MLDAGLLIEAGGDKDNAVRLSEDFSRLSTLNVRINERGYWQRGYELRPTLAEAKRFIAASREYWQESSPTSMLILSGRGYILEALEALESSLPLWYEALSMGDAASAWGVYKEADAIRSKADAPIEKLGEVYYTLWDGGIVD